jgi:hypothetical protein
MTCMYRLYVDNTRVASFDTRQAAIDEADVLWAMGRGERIEVYRQTAPGYWVLIHTCKEESN